MRYLVATDSVHTTAAACDYLEPRLNPDDAVDVLTVVSPADGRNPLEDPRRDAGDAANVATARLLGPATVEVLSREGSPAEVVLQVARARDADVVVLGTHGGRPGAGPRLGSVTRAVLEEVAVPSVIVPLPDRG